MTVKELMKKLKQVEYKNHNVYIKMNDEVIDAVEHCNELQVVDVEINENYVDLICKED